jgi:2-C-methyl-D-erythritol 4-phosphate cytidylyltransferase
MAPLLTCRNFLLLLAVPNIAIIVAAGKGRRFGGLKQFSSVRGRPLFLYSLAAFEQCRSIASIVLAVPKARLDYVRRIVRNAGMTKVTQVVAGGRRRQDSVKNALKALPHEHGIVAIHDAVRPLVSVRMINKGIRLCREYRAVVFGVPVADTLKQVKDTIITRTVPRNDIFAVQTPQYYDLALLKQAFNKADTAEFTDEAALLESQGKRVHLFSGDPRNIKVTTKNDLALIDKML